MVEIGVAAIAAIASIVGAWIARGARKEAQQANNAVNHIGPGEDRLVDMVKDLRESVAAIEGQLDLLRQLVVAMVGERTNRPS